MSQESFITKRKLQAFTVVMSVFFTLSTFTTPFFQLGSIVSANTLPDSFPPYNPSDITEQAEPVLLDDVTGPTGSIDIDNGNEETSDANIEIRISAQDPVIDGATNSGIGSYIISQSSDFSDTTWQPYDGSETTLNLVIPNAPNLSAPLAGTYTYYVQFRDNAHNESEIYSDSITFVATVPTGGIEIDKDEQVDPSTGSGQVPKEVQDNNLELELTANSNVPVTNYKVALSPDELNTNEWLSFEDQSRVSQLVAHTLQLPDQTGDYTIYVQYRNNADQTSEIYSSSIYYQSYDITPELGFGLEDGQDTKPVLYGDQMELSAHVTNTGSDIGYNARFEIVLPKGFEFIEALSCEDLRAGCGGSSFADSSFEDLRRTGASEDKIEPTFITTNSEGLQVLTYEGIDDVLPGESTSIHAIVSVGGEDEGYKLGDTVDIPITSQLFKRSNFKTGFEVTDTLHVELKPFRVDFDGGNGACPEPCRREELVEDIVENKITIETNPDIESDPAIGEEKEDETLADTDPVVIQFELDNGTSYIEDSQTIFINGTEIDQTEYNIVFEYFDDLVTGYPVIKWVFGDQLDVDQLVEIYFESKINKIEDETILGLDFTQHDQLIEEKLLVDGQYSNEGESSETYTEDETNEITAKYFTVSKSASPWRTDINETVRYTIRIETSQEYDLSGIEITDEIPDGVNFDELTADLSYSEDLLLNLFDYSVDPETGEEILIWRINAADGIPAGTVYEYSYKVTIDSNYDVKQLEDGTPEGGQGDDRIFSRDHLTSKVTVKGLWTDVDDGTLYTREETIDERIIEDNDWAGNRLHEVTFSEGIRHSILPSGEVPQAEGVWSTELDAKIGDILDVYGELTFPTNTPTNNVNYRVYLPIGTELNGNFNITSDLGIAITPEKIEGGYLFELGKVEPGKLFKVEYQLNVLNDANLKEAVKTRNLFRGDYTNIDDRKFTYRESVTLNLIEPQIDVTKKVTSGYLARGEEAVVKTTITNSGTDGAYGLNITDSVPTNTEVLGVSCQVLVEDISTDVPCEITDETLSLLDWNLQPGDSITITYNLKTNPSVIFGDDIDSEITISDFSNRDEADPLPARLYQAEVYAYNWNAKEALLITSALEVEVGRNQSYQYIFNVDLVGGAPVYDITAVVDFAELDITDDLDSISYIVLIDGTEKTVTASDITNGLYTFENIDLLPNQELSIVFELNTPLYVGFNQSFTTSIATVGFDALENTIQVDGSAETDKDTDIDDMDTGAITIAKSDFEAPTGSIKFRIEGSEVSATNQESVDELLYQAQDNTGIAGVQFSNDSTIWNTNNELEVLSSDITELLGLEGSWNAWPFDSAQDDNSILITQDTEFESEGRNYRYMRVVDVEGNIAIVENSIIKDTLPPLFADVIISPLENDFTDPLTTATIENYINFYAYDNKSITEEVSDIGSFSYSFDGIGWSEWVPINQEEYSQLVGFPEVEEEEELYIYLQIQDKAGNLMPIILTDSITYDQEFTGLSMVINDDATYTSSSAVDLHLDVTDTRQGVQEIRYSISDPCEESTCEFSPWESLNLDEIQYSDTDSSEIVWSAQIPAFLNKHWEEGAHELCIQLRDEATNLSNISCDTILLDFSSPIGSIEINNNEEESTTKNILLNIEASDPNLQEGVPGSGETEMYVRYSDTTQDNCEQKQEGDSKSECLSKWSDWEDWDNNKTWTLEDRVGSQTISIQLKDPLNNISEVYSDEIVYNPFIGTGGIEINNNDLFTNTKNVELNLSVDITELCPGCVEPVLVRFSQTDEVGNSISNSPESSFTDWYEYPSETQLFQWNLDQDSSFTNYGLKTVFVEYKLPDTNIIGPYSDSIIYAPYYGVEYSSVDESTLAENEYTISNIPSEMKTQDSIDVIFNAENIGSFTWPNDGLEPVRITYKWKRVGGDLPNGWTEELVPQEYRGNAYVLPGRYCMV